MNHHHHHHYHHDHYDHHTRHRRRLCVIIVINIDNSTKLQSFIVSPNHEKCNFNEVYGKNRPFTDMDKTNENLSIYVLVN
uniref:Uncharacterized protein n=1 Tax=Glossina austeni TaxID=7395 RepID=A0A1A9UJ95_GLOAU